MNADVEADIGSRDRVTLSQANLSWYVYMIRADDNSLYTGITTDVERRLAEHKGETAGAFKGAKALRSKRKLEVVFTHAMADRSQASRLESRIKRLSKTGKEALVRGQLALQKMIDEID